MKNFFSIGALVIGLVVSNVIWATVYFFEMDKAVATSPAKQKIVTKESNRKGLIRGAVLKQSTKVQACYEDFLRREPEKQVGAISVQWAVDPDGKVQDANLAKAELGDSVLHECIIENVRALRFDPPPKGEPVMMAHKFNFKQKNPNRIEF